VHGWKCIRRRRRQREKEGKTREICRLVVIEDGDEQANDFFGDLFGRLQNELKIEVSSGRRCVFTCSLKKLMKRKRKIEFFGYFVAMCDRRRRMRRKMVVYSGIGATAGAPSPFEGFDKHRISTRASTSWCVQQKEFNFRKNQKTKKRKLQRVELGREFAEF
jgi:hypothetical protein